MLIYYEQKDIFHLPFSAADMLPALNHFPNIRGFLPTETLIFGYFNHTQLEVAYKCVPGHPVCVVYKLLCDLSDIPIPLTAEALDEKLSPILDDVAHWASNPPDFASLGLVPNDETVRLDAGRWWYNGVATLRKRGRPYSGGVFPIFKLDETVLLYDDPASSDWKSTFLIDCEDRCICRTTCKLQYYPKLRNFR